MTRMLYLFKQQPQHIKAGKESKNNLAAGKLHEAARFFSNSGLDSERLVFSFRAESIKLFRNWHKNSHKEKVKAINIFSLLIYQKPGLRNSAQFNLEKINNFLILLNNNAAFANVFFQVFAFVLYDITNNCKNIKLEKIEEELLKIINKGPEHLFVNYTVLSVANPELRSEKDRNAYREAVTVLHTKLQPQNGVQLSWNSADIKCASVNLEQKLADNFPKFLTDVKNIVHSKFWDKLKRVYRDTVNAVSSIISGHSKEAKPLATSQYVQQSSLNAACGELVDNKVNVQPRAEHSAKTAALLNAVEDVKTGLQNIIPPALRFTKASPAA